MKYKINTEFVCTHGATLNQGASLFTFLSYTGFNHVRLCSYAFAAEVEVYIDTREDADDVVELSKSFLSPLWEVEVCDFSDSDPKFFVVSFTYEYDSKC